jgi:uncharacterized membrane protein YecN with MAPEG domain
MVTPVYAALLGLLFVFLSIRTILLRRRLKIGIGTGDNPSLLRAVRVHANFAEYIPMALLLLLMIELQGSYSGIVHVLGMLLVLGRISHSWGVSRVKEKFGFRVFGMACTFTVILASTLMLLTRALIPTS